MKAILFDLDGTLLPMDNDEFTQAYFTLLGQTIAPLIAPDRLTKSVWAGTKAMVKNDGSATNEQRFWDTFVSLEGEGVRAHIPKFDAFYANEFRQAVSSTRPNPLAVRAVQVARRKADKVVLATNPLFPRAGIATRLSWIGFQPTDFDLVTTYEICRFCKPNPNYYADIAETIGVSPADCLMVGNDAEEDIAAARAAGMRAYQVIDCALGLSEGPRGSFADMVEFIENLP